MESSPREIWAQRVGQWKKSGLGVEEYAAKAGLSFHTLRNWRYRLEAEARAAEGSGQGLRPVGFVELAMPGTVRSPRAKGKPGMSLPVSEPFELVLGDGLRLRIPQQFDAATLRLVVSALEER